jgi:excisionase family DNA binding protein
LKIGVRVVLPLLIEAAEVCAKLHISTTTLRRWEARKAIPFVPLGKDRRYLPAKVEKSLRAQRFGPVLPPTIKDEELRERIPVEDLCEWLHIGRKTLQRRMDDGLIPFYRIGQTYRVAPDEVLFALGIEVPSERQDSPKFPSGGLE